VTAGNRFSEGYGLCIDIVLWKLKESFHDCTCPFLLAATSAIGAPVIVFVSKRETNLSFSSFGRVLQNELSFPPGPDIRASMQQGGDSHKAA